MLLEVTDTTHCCIFQMNKRIYKAILVKIFRKTLQRKGNKSTRSLNKITIDWGERARSMGMLEKPMMLLRKGDR